MGSRIMGIDYYLPERTLTNKDLAELYPEYNEEKIYSKTGILTRHIAAEDEHVSDMAVNAANKLLQKIGFPKEEVDFLILCTESPDYKLPHTTSIIQERLGLNTNIGAFDINLGCSGFVYALATAKGLIHTGMARHVLLIMSETYSKYIHEYDRSTRTIFGDGAAATLIGYCENEHIGEFVFGTDGSGKERLIVPAGGGALRQDEETAKCYTDSSGTRSKNNLYMDGSEIFHFTVDIIPRLTNDVLKKNAIVMDQVDYVVPHQANRFILEYLRKEMGIPENKFCMNLETVGNTVSASIPIAMEQAFMNNNMNHGDNVILLGFGVGYSWAGTLIRW